MTPGHILTASGVVLKRSDKGLKPPDKCRIASGVVLKSPDKGLKPPYKCRIAPGVVLKTSGVILIVSGQVLQ
jgi:hypothetical protein